MSNAAALRIAAVSTDVVFNTMEDIFITGLCRAEAGIPCTTVPGVPRTNLATKCDVVSGRVISIENVNVVQQTRLWNFMMNETAVERACASKTSTWYVVATCMALLFIICCFSYCRRKLSAVLLLRKS